jgi:uncharacterized protein YbjT (DUF2867 family)
VIEVAFVLVTGAAGTLGNALVPRLVGQGHQVRVLLHRRSAGFPPEVHVARGDVRAGQACSGENGAHVVYPSIVGVDRLGGTYYRAKWQAEQLVASVSGSTIQRATQLHPTLDKMLSHRMFPVTAHLAFQPLDAGDLAERLVGLVEAGPARRAEDLGGPEVLALRDIAAARRAVTGRRTVLIPVPALGPLRALDAGHHLCPDHPGGHITWEQWLSRNPQPGAPDDHRQGRYPRPVR